MGATSLLKVRYQQKLLEVGNVGIELEKLLVQKLWHLLAYHEIFTLH